MGKSIPQNPRKLKRYLENEYYAQSARFWMGAVKTVDRSTEFRYPINRQTRNSVSYSTKSPRKNKRVKEKKLKTIVYAVKFEDLKGKSPTFIKVGITGNMIEERFLADFERYKFSLVGSKIVWGRKEALILEESIHKLLEKHSFRPEKILLSGGNSECFVYTDKLEKFVYNLLT